MDDYVGAYVQAAPASIFRLDPQWKTADDECFHYDPNIKVVFRYRRRAFMEVAGTSITYYGAIIADDMSPLLRIAATGVNYWPERVDISRRKEYDVCPNSLSHLELLTRIICTAPQCIENLLEPTTHRSSFLFPRN